MAQCLPVPKGWSELEAAGLPETFFTVWSNVFERGHLQAGETLLVQGGSSGIGVTAIQEGQRLGDREAAHHEPAREGHVAALAHRDQHAEQGKDGATAPGVARHPPFDDARRHPQIGRASCRERV